MQVGANKLSKHGLWKTVAVVYLAAAEADAGAPGVARSNQAAIDGYIFHDWS